jgi:hypothetical protein
MTQLTDVHFDWTEKFCGIANLRDQPVPATSGVAQDVHAKSRLVWTTTRQKVERDLANLKSSILAACDGQDIEAALEAAFRSEVEPVLSNLDESLAHKLDEVNRATAPTEREKYLADARLILRRYQSFVATEPIIAKLDANPFVKLALGATLAKTLSGLDAVLR